MAIAEDASAPAFKTGTGSGSISTGSFSPPAGSLVVVMVAAGWNTASGSSNTTWTVPTLTDSGSHTWTRRILQNDSTVANQGGCAAVYTGFFSSAPGAISLTATFTNLSGGSMIATKVLTGASSTLGATGGTTNTTTAGTTSVTTTQAGSMVYGCANDWSGADAFTANASTTKTDDFNDTTDIVRLVAFKSSSTTGSPGATTFGGTWGATAGSHVVGLEILPATNSAAPTAGLAAATAAARQPTNLAGTAVNAGLATAVAADNGANVGVVALAGKASATAAVRDVGRNARPAQATASAAVVGGGVFNGTPLGRTAQIPTEPRTLGVPTQVRSYVLPADVPQE